MKFYLCPRLHRGGTEDHRFYYRDERKAAGSAAFKVDGEAHGKLYTALAEARLRGLGSRHL